MGLGGRRLVVVVERVEHLRRAVLEEDPADAQLVLALRHLAHLGLGVG